MNFLSPNLGVSNNKVLFSNIDQVYCINLMVKIKQNLYFLSNFIKKNWKSYINDIL